MWQIITEIATYLCHLAMIYLVAYANINPQGFYQVNHLRQFLLNSRQGDADYAKVSAECWR